MLVISYFYNSNKIIMKRFYPQIIIAFVFSVLLSFTASAQILPNDVTIEPARELACTMKVTGQVNRMYIPMRESVRQKIENRIAPCATINVNYNNFPTDIFGNPGEAQLAFQFAVDIWENLIDTPVTINIVANYANQGPSTLGSAGAAFHAQVPGGPTNVLYPAALAEKITGAEINGVNSVDINCTFNSAFQNWYFGTDGNTPANDFDFVTIVLHEIGHGLGIVGFGRERDNNGQANGVIRRNQFGNFPADINDPSAIYPSIWDTFVQNQDIFGQDVDILSETDDFGSPLYPDPSVELLGGMTNNLLTVSSPVAVLKNGGTAPKLYAPSSFNGGSSYSHWDENTFNNTATALMTPFAARGEAIHDPGDVTLGFMQDMGWTICDRILGDEDFTLKNIKVSPNPFTESISIEIPSNLANQQFNVSVTDINGRVVLNQNANTTSNEITIKNLSNLDSALYFLTIKSTTSDLIITKKIIKE